MYKKSLLMFDPMRTGYADKMINFIQQSSLHENFDICQNLYELDRYNDNDYIKKIVFFDIFNSSESLANNKLFLKDLTNRVNFFLEQQFKIIFCRQWEINFESKIIDHLKNNIKKFEYKTWGGNESWFYFYMYVKYKDKNLNFDHSKKIFDFLYLNKSKRTHRKLLWDALQKKNILKNSLISNHFNEIHLQKNYELPQFYHKDYPLLGFDQDIHPPQFNHSAINIVSETSCDQNNFLTEKIWKPIIAGQIFVVHSGHGYLKTLHRMGFKTFGEHFDESYDDERDLFKRTNKIVNLCCSLVEKDYAVIYKNCKSILDHNRKVFFDKNNLSKIIDNTLLSLFEFPNCG